MLWLAVTRLNGHIQLTSGASDGFTAHNIEENMKGDSRASTTRVPWILAYCDVRVCWGIEYKAVRRPPPKPPN